MFDMRCAIRAMAPKRRAAGSAILHPPALDPYASYALKWDGEWQITYETFRDMGAPYASA